MDRRSFFFLLVAVAVAPWVWLGHRRRRVAARVCVSIPESGDAGELLNALLTEDQFIGRISVFHLAERYGSDPLRAG